MALGLMLHRGAGASPARRAATSGQAGWIGSLLHNWAIVPAHPTTFGNVGFVALIVMIIGLVQLRGRWRAMLLVPTLYLATCVWEARLVEVPAITRRSSSV